MNTQLLYKITILFVVSMSFMACSNNSPIDIKKPKVLIDSTRIKDSILKADSVLKIKTPLVVIIKADDFWYLTPKWKKFIDIIIRQNICASIGLIGKRIPNVLLLKDSLSKIVNLNQPNGNGVIEFWNHGYDHIHTGGEDYEFYKDYSTQLSHIKLNQDILYSVTSKTCHTFSTPFNRSNYDTKRALDKLDDIHVVMRYPQTEEYKFDGWVNPDSNQVTKKNTKLYLDIHYSSLQKLNTDGILRDLKKLLTKKYLVVQIHPQAWEDEEEFEKFEKFISILKKQKLKFMTPYQYYNSLHQ